MGIILAVLSCLLLGIANVLLKKSFKDFPPAISFFIFTLISAFTWLPTGLILGVNLDTWLFGIGVGFLSAVLGQAFYIYVLEKGEISITATILSSFSIYTILFSVLFNHEVLTSATSFFILLTILGTIIVSFPEKFSRSELKKMSLVLWPIAAAVAIGASDTITKNYITNSSVGSFLFFVSFAQLFVSIAYLKWAKQPLNQLQIIFKSYKDYVFAAFGSLCISISTLFLFLSFRFTLASIASPIVASAPVITVILAVFFLKEKIRPKDFIGLAFVLISIIAIGYLNP
ncbi:DMT family transporter [Candidatus Roizmanbacteria bacterium]|nr:DMT family transporter [Candidatus Roizmanbacteria bacterium]